MYQIIIDDKVIFSTDNKTVFIEYLFTNHMITQVLKELLPQTYTVNFATK